MSRPPACPICDAPGASESRFGPAPLWHCAACDFVYLHGEVASELYADAYFETYSGGDYRDQEPQRRFESRRRVEQLARVAPSGRILEIGAAAGFFLDEVARLGYQPVGVEPNGAMAAHARDALGLDVRVGMLDDVALESVAYDVVCAFHVVEHLEDPLASLRTMREALRPGGHLLVEVPNAASSAARRQGQRWQPLDLPYHVGHHSPRSMRTLLERAGFEVLEVDTIPFAYYVDAPQPMRVAQVVAESIRIRSLLPPGSHPTDHQLLRVIGRRPADFA